MFKICRWLFESSIEKPLLALIILIIIVFDLLSNTVQIRTNLSIIRNGTESKENQNGNGTKPERKRNKIKTKPIQNRTGPEPKSEKNQNGTKNRTEPISEQN